MRRSASLLISCSFLLVAAGGVLTALAPRAWLTLLLDGAPVLCMLAAAAGLGIWPTRWLLREETRPGVSRVAAQAIGLGLLGLIVLVLGAVGLLNRVTAWGVVGAGLVLGALHLVGKRDAGLAGFEPARTEGALSRSAVLRGMLLMLLAVPLGVGIFGATLPPGILWNGEGNGYDVLEYHLEVPREYYEAGRIVFLPHNVYASFPQQMEMHYLLLMHLLGSAYAAAIPGQLLHAACGVLAVVAVCAFVRSAWARVVVALLMGGAPWLAYVGSLAYNELGMLLFAGVGAGLLLDAVRSRQTDARRMTAAGLCLGFACGCKYTAVVLVAGSLLVAAFAALPLAISQRIRLLAVSCVAALAAFSPWLVRNYAFTGNPVYPFASRSLGGAGWSAEQATQWDVGHRLSGESATIVGRCKLAWSELVGSSLFGPAVFVCAVLGSLRTRSRQTLFLLISAVLMLVGWATLTAMPGRFMLPVIIPLALLAAGLFETAPPAAGVLGRGKGGQTPVAAEWKPFVGRLGQLAIILIALIGSVQNAWALFGLVLQHDQQWRDRSDFTLAEMVGQVEAMRDSNFVNTHTPEDAHVRLVGDAAVYYVARRKDYSVVFNGDPWLKFCAAGAESAAAVDWLRTQKVTHVVFSWPEVARLRRTYGFPELVTPGWVRSLESAGLRRVHAQTSVSGVPIIEVYEVLPE